MNAIENRKSKIENRKVVHLVSSLNVGGLEQFAVRMAHAQRGRGMDALVLTLHDGALREEAARLGVPVVVLGGAGNEPRGLRELKKASRVVRAILMLRKLNADVIHAHNPVTLHYALLGKTGGGKAKVVLTCHGRGKNEMKLPPAEQWSKTDAVVAVSQAVLDETPEAQQAGVSCVIRNGIEPTQAKRSRAEVRAELGLSEAACVGLLAARMDHLKGHEILLDALAFLKRRGIALTILFAGDGKERAARESHARELGLTASEVQFLGFRSDVPDLLAASDVFVLPSFSEGLPLSVLEAMAQSLPIVATTVGGIPEVVTDGVEGLLVPPRDASALADALAQVVLHKDTREKWGRAGKTRVAMEFTFDGMLEAYDSIYHEILR